MAHRITTIGDLDISPENMATSQVFAGAQNRAQIGAYMGALAWEKSVKGATVGLVAGILLTVGLGLYLRREGHV
jgi:hypothetical protein